MRLLEKREIDQKRAEQERARNAEGAKLARKVEQVRELEAETRSGYERYRETALQGIKDELAPLYEERDVLTDQVKAKRRELLKLFEPLDKQFALYVKTERELIEAEQARLALEAQKLNGISVAQAETQVAQDNCELQIAQSRIEAEQMRKNAETLAEKAKTDEIAAKTRSSILIESANKQVATSQRQAQETALEAQQVKNRKNALDVREKELEGREMAVIIKELQQYSPIKKL